MSETDDKSNAGDIVISVSVDVEPLRRSLAEAEELVRQSVERINAMWASVGTAA